MAEKKDIWDKLDVVLKALVPVAVGLMLLAWNNQRTTQQTAAAMTEIAVGILAEEPVAREPNALRVWAIGVLQNPSDPPRLTDEAATELKEQNLPSVSPSSRVTSSSLSPETSAVLGSFIKGLSEGLNER